FSTSHPHATATHRDAGSESGRRGPGEGASAKSRGRRWGRLRGHAVLSEVAVAAKLGRAVEHARLPAHEERPDAVRAHRRKDFVYRVRDQGSLLGRDK